MLATLLDSSEGSTSAFIGELCDLLRAGLRSRSRATADAGLKRLMADGFCLAAMLWIAVTISEPSGFQPTSRRFWLIAAALALVGYDRVAGLVGFTWIVLFGRGGTVRRASPRHRHRGVRRPASYFPEAWALRTDNAASPLWVALVAPGLTVVALAAARVRQLQRQTLPSTATPSAPVPSNSTAPHAPAHATSSSASDGA
jgi:hypothetical protein